MNLIIDVGNTFVKFAIFDEDHLVHKELMVLDVTLERFNIIKNKFNITNAIISSVGRLNKTDVDTIGSCFKLITLDFNTKLPFKNLYKTPKTLGVDRIALVSASVKQYPNSNVLIIDAGTCITYDFINKNNDYLGGSISPGLHMRYKALHNLTANLPLLETEMPYNILGNSTETAIHSGVVYGVLKEIDGVIEQYKANYSDLTVILTGGDSNFLSKQLKSSIFATSNFLLEGLNYILKYNSHE